MTDCNIEILKPRTSAKSDKLKQRFARLYESGQFSDCIFLVDDVKIRAHRLILATISPVFEAMFYSSFANEDLIHVTDMNVIEFKQLLNYIYTDNVQVETIDNAWRLLYAAKKYLITSLTEICLDYIQNNLNERVVLNSYELAEVYEETSIKNACLNMIKKYTSDILVGDYHMNGDTLSVILDQNELNVPEWNLVCAVVAWSDEECTIRNIPNTLENRRAVLDEEHILSKIRFLTLPIECFEDSNQVIRQLFTRSECYYFREYKKHNSGDCQLLFHDFNLNQQERTPVQLTLQTASRLINKGNTILRINSTHTYVNTCITSSRRVNVHSFMVPTRLVSKWITHYNSKDDNTYVEEFIVSITDMNTNEKIVTDTPIKVTVPNSASFQVKLLEVAKFKGFTPYLIQFNWTFDNFDLNSYEYSLDGLSGIAERKGGAHFVLRSNYDFIQSISYSL